MNPSIQTELSEFFHRLPTELFFYIFSFLEIADLCRCAQVPVLWRNICYTPMLYKAIDMYHFRRRVDDNVIHHVTSRCNLVQYLDLTDCIYITNSSLYYITSLLNLLELNLTGCDHISYEGIQYLENCPSLISINLTGIKNINDFCLQHLSKCQSLEYIDLRCIYDISITGLTILGENCKNLKRLIFSKHISDEDLKQLQDMNPGIQQSPRNRIAFYLTPIDSIDLPKLPANFSSRLNARPTLRIRRMYEFITEKLHAALPLATVGVKGDTTLPEDYIEVLFDNKVLAPRINLGAVVNTTEQGKKLDFYYRSKDHKKLIPLQPEQEISADEPIPVQKEAEASFVTQTNLENLDTNVKIIAPAKQEPFISVLKRCTKCIIL